jgi:hypothetical protein
MKADTQLRTCEAKGAKREDDRTKGASEKQKRLGKTAKPAASERFTIRNPHAPCARRRAPSSFRHIRHQQICVR